MPRFMCRPTATFILLVSAVGCGGKSDAPGFSSFSARSDQGAKSAASDRSGDELNLALLQNTGSTEGNAAAKDTAAPRLERKIIYSATLDLVVENFADVATGVAELARQHNAFIAKSSIDTAAGRPRSGSWTFRVPVARYDEFLNAAGALGELQLRTEDSREVTAEYYDLDTRIRNKHVEEERLLKHLAESTGKLEDILAVEKELSRVRTEMEQMQGQLRMLQDLTALSTVTLNVTEIQGYVPAESPTFGTQISRAWRQSWDGLVAAARVAVVVAVAFTPWLIIVGPPIMVVMLLRRRSLRRKRETATRL